MLMHGLGLRLGKTVQEIESLAEPKPSGFVDMLPRG